MAMRAIVVHEPGGREVLGAEELPEPRPGEGEVLVRVEAVGVNHIDLANRADGAGSFPVVLGSDAAGRREDTGERVLVTQADGTYADRVVAQEENVFAIPDSLGAAAGAALGTPYLTAWWSIVDLRGLKERQTLLVQGCPTATGQASVDIGRALGAKGDATAPGERLDAGRGLGGEAISYGDPGGGGIGGDVVFAPIGAD